MATKLFVGKLSYDTTSDSLKALFAKHGNVTDAQVIIDRDTNRSKGFGFVEMEDQAAAQAAIEAINGKDFEGRTIVVNVAKPREERTPNGGSSFRGGYPRR